MSDELRERDVELEALREALATAREGTGAAVVVQGPAGIGKSALVDAVIALAAPGVVLRARGGELERDFAFGVARQLFEPLLAGMGATLRHDALSGAAALAAPVVGLDEEHPKAGDRLYAVMHGLYWLTLNLAADEPLVIVVDDAQWADEQTMMWLAYLVRRISDVGVLVVLATRREDAGELPRPIEAVAAEPITRTVTPQPLSPQAGAALLADVLGAAPAAAVARTCHERSAGNPFVLHELGLALAQAGAQNADIEHLLPESVARGVLARLAALPPDAVALARALAVLGDDAQLGDAARLADIGDSEAAAAFDTLVARGFVLAQPPLCFAHPLMREAIYADISPAKRQFQHRRAASVLAARIAPERIGAHLLACEPRGDPESVAVLRRCGARAQARGALQNAVRYYARALEELPDPSMRGTVLRELGRAEARAGQPAAVEHLREACELAESTAALGAATSDLSMAIAATGDIAQAAATLERGIAAVAGRDRELELQLTGELSATGQLDVSLTPRVGERLRGIAPDLAGRSPAERLVLASYAHLRSNELADPAELADLAQRALGDGLLLAEQTADSPAFYLLIYVFYRAGRNDLADHWLAKALDDTRARGSLLGNSIALTVRGQLRWLRGELADAEADAQTTIDAQREAGWGAVLPLAVHVLGECLLERGRGEEALRLFADAGLTGALPEIAVYRWAQATRGRARVAAGEIEPGLADLLDCERASMGTRAGLAMLWRADAALALAAKGETADALALAEEQLALAREARIDRVHGVALRTLGLLRDGNGAEPLLREAVLVLERSSARLEHARALIELGAYVRRSGQRGAAREPLTAGHDIARSCGGDALVARATAELAAAGARPRRPAFSGRDALTPSERRVAEMAAEGLSNPEIAQALFVARKTIEMHLGRVYRKLAVSGREELATALTSNGSG